MTMMFVMRMLLMIRTKKNVDHASDVDAEDEHGGVGAGGGGGRD